MVAKRAQSGNALLHKCVNALLPPEIKPVAISSVLQPGERVTRPSIARYKKVQFATFFSINLCCLKPLNGPRSKSSGCSWPVVDG